MYIEADTLDDLLHHVFESILAKGEIVAASTKGPNKELFGVLLELTQPLARVSRSEIKGRLSSALGEFLWYLAGSNELSFIDYYLRGGYKSDDGKTVWGAYGPRLYNQRNINQLSQIVDLLIQKPSSRQAVIQLFNAEDISKVRADTPCTCTLQFLVRGTGLDMFVSMRSNDAFKGLPHDIFAFTMLQELIARELGIEVGRYKHAAGSLHLYDDDEQKAKEYLAEGWQDPIQMPTMPKGNQWAAIGTVIKAEKAIREKQPIEIERLELDSYWLDIVRILQIFAFTKGDSSKLRMPEVDALAGRMSTQFFQLYIRDRQKRAQGQ